MVRKSKRSKQSDDMERYINQRVRNPPRLRIKGNLGENTVLSGVEVTTSLTTDANGNAFLVVPLIGGATTGLDTVNISLMNVAKLYNQFVFQSCAIRYIPAVGLNTAGNVTIAFTNNTETVAYCLETVRTFAEVKAVCFSQCNSATHPVWHEFTYPMKLPARRKRFDTNSTSPIANLDTIERDCQGAFIIVVSGSEASKLITTPRRESRILLEGLSNSVA